MFSTNILNAHTSWLRVFCLTAISVYARFTGIFLLNRLLRQAQPAPIPLRLIPFGLLLNCWGLAVLTQAVQSLCLRHVPAAACTPLIRRDLGAGEVGFASLLASSSLNLLFGCMIHVSSEVFRHSITLTAFGRFLCCRFCCYDTLKHKDNLMAPG